MKIINNQQPSSFITSDDIIMTGETIGKTLSNVVNEHERDIDDLKNYTKWLYKYGGTGSKYGGGGNSGGSTSYSLNATVNLNNTILSDSSKTQIILNGASQFTINTNINFIVGCEYYISIKNNSKYVVGGKNSPVKITDSTWYQHEYTVKGFNLDSDTYTITLIASTPNGQITKTYIADVIKDAYIFNLYFAKNDYTQINNNDLWVNELSNGLYLCLDYNVIADNEIEYELSGVNIENMFDSLNGIINEKINNIPKRKDKVYINFKQDFLNIENSGFYNISIKLNVNESTGVQTIYKQISFNLMPNNSTYLKVAPINSAQKIYKYNESHVVDICDTYKIYDELYTAYIDLNIKNKELSNKSRIIEIIRNNFNNNISNDINDSELNTEISNAIKVFENNIYVYSAGNIGFNITAYQGSEYGSNVNIECDFRKIDPENISDGIDGTTQNLLGKNGLGIESIKLRTPQNVFLNIGQSGIYRISFFSNENMINGADNVKPVYYIYVYEKAAEVDWYESTIKMQAQNYWRNGETTYQLRSLKNSYRMQKYANDLNKTNIMNIIKSDDLNEIDNIGYPQDSPNDIMISIGLQYSANNRTTDDNGKDIPLIEILSNLSSTPNIINENKSNIIIYQNKVQSNGENAQIYIPKEEDYNIQDPNKYHLITIYKRYLYTNNGNNYYEFNIYIDGVIENALTSFIGGSNPILQVNLWPANFAINLLEVTYFIHNEENNNKRIDENGNSNYLSYMDDIAISEYFYKYASTHYDKNYIDQNLPAYNTAKTIISSLREFAEVSNGLIKVSNQDAINNIANKCAIPVLLFEHSDMEKGEFVRYYTQKYGAGSTVKGILELEKLFYSPGQKNLEEVKMPSIEGVSNNCKWYIEPQGTSTLTNFAKNLNLGITQECPGYSILFTPNFKYVDFNNASESEKKEAKNTFLPETKFTLKADQVDSTHSNNTAVGAFVNTNTTPFINEYINNYSNYIKNCLLGFATLVFIKVNEKTEIGETPKTTYYFLGIMNFNLGRDSHFNMGYNDLNILNTGQCKLDLESCDGQTFKVTYVSLASDTSVIQNNKNVIVAEIQDGDTHFDFSQADKSILFPQMETDGGAMFGDFIPSYSGVNVNFIESHLQRLVDNISLCGGFLFSSIGKHFGSYDQGYNAYIKDKENSIFNSANQVPNYMIQYERILVGTNTIWSVKNVRDEIDLSYNTQMSRLNTLLFGYASEDEEPKQPILNYIATSEYYTTCMAFGLVDSVIKNLNVKTWNASENTGENISGTWFPAFYDMDTAFGYNNGGRDVSYFAFSDYWFTKYTPGTKLESATIYRDFYPKNEGYSVGGLEIGYDIPSNYLFAIAKYAPVVLENDVLKLNNPANIWARWRSINGNSSILGSTGAGELKNADYFIDKYFVRNLNEIPEQIWNMNYRLKYLKRIKQIESYETNVNNDWYTYDTSENGMYEEDNKAPLRGKGIYRLREWLSSRFHILDAYFNIEGNNKKEKYPISKLNYTYDIDAINLDDQLLDKLLDTSTYSEINNARHNFYEEYNSANGHTYRYWKDCAVPLKTTGGDYNWVYATNPNGNNNYYDNVASASIADMRNNTDIIILRDAFSSTAAGNKYDNTITFICKAKKYSPIITIDSTDNHKKFLITDPNKEYNIEIIKFGTQVSSIGGTTNLTYIDNLNTLVVNENLTVNSKNLESIVLTAGRCSTYNFVTPALKTLSITKANDDDNTYFSGSLSFDASSGGDKYPSLNIINITNTSIDLSIVNEGVTEVIANGVNSSLLNIIDCSNLSNVSLSDATISTCQIMPGWSNNINISSNIKNLKISPKDITKETRTFEINTNNSLETLTLKDFTNIRIIGCPNLHTIEIINPQHVKSLQIINCNLSKNSKAFRLLVSSTDETINNISATNINSWDQNHDNWVDSCNWNLEGFFNLQEVSFSGTKGINKLIFKQKPEYKDKYNRYSITHTDGKTYSGIKLLTSALSNSFIQYIEMDEPNGNEIPNTLFILGAAVFQNSAYVFYDNANEQNVNPNVLFITNTVTSLQNMFFKDYPQYVTNIITQNRLSNDDVEVILNNNVSSSTRSSVIYEDITKIKNISGMFHGQSGISVANINSTGVNVEKSMAKLSLKNFTHVNNISNIYNHTNINAISEELFGLTVNENYQYVGQDESVTILNIDNIINTGQLYCHVNTFSPIIDKVELLINNSTNISHDFILFNGTSDSYKVIDIDNNEEPIKIRELFKSKTDIGYTNKPLPNLKHIRSLNISNDSIDWHNAFISDNGEFMFPNLVSIQNSFNRNGLLINGYQENKNFDHYGLSLYKTKISFSSCFNLHLDIPVNYENILDLSTYTYIPVNSIGLYKTFVMSKWITESKFIDIIEDCNSNSVNKTTNINCLFKDINIIKTGVNLDDENNHIFRTTRNVNGEPFIFETANSAFENMKIFCCEDAVPTEDFIKHININETVKPNTLKVAGDSTPDDSSLINSYAIIFDQNSLKRFTKCKVWDYAFANIILGRNLPLNLFNHHKNNMTDYNYDCYNTVITSMEGTFSNIKFKKVNNESYIETYFRHESYRDICKIDNENELDVNKYNANMQLNGSYHPLINIDNLLANESNISNSNASITIANYIAKNLKVNHENNNEIDNPEEITKHLILPFDIFYGCTLQVNLRKCFSNSEFEGILPSLLFDKFNKNSSAISINNIFENLLVIPNRIYNSDGKDYIYLETHLLKGLDYGMNIENSMYNKLIKILIDNNDFDNSGYYYTLDGEDQQRYETRIWQRHPTYVFVPRNFYSVGSLVNAFNFKLLLPKSKINNVIDDQNVRHHNDEYEFYFILSDLSISKNGTPVNLSLIENSLPGMPNGSSQTYEFPYIVNYIGENIINNINTNGEQVLNLFKPRAYHNIHYSTMLRESEISSTNQLIGVNLNGGSINQQIEDTDTCETMTQKINIDYNLRGLTDIAPLDYGISYKHFGIKLTANLRNSLLGNFMNAPLLMVMFGHIFYPGDNTNNEILGINIPRLDSNITYKYIFTANQISKYCGLPKQTGIYQYIINFSYIQNGPLVLSRFNIQEQTELNKNEGCSYIKPEWHNSQYWDSVWNIDNE